MTIAIYIRVSTTEQAKEGYSIAAQKERLLAFCKAQGWESYKFYVDEGVSAKNTNRPELQRLFNDMRQGNVSMILVYRLDRFTRKVIDFHKMLEEMKEYNCTFKSATEPYDTSSAMGRMFISLVATIAQWETENLSERIKMALEEKVSSGERVGNIPFGFNLDENDRLVKNDKSIVVLDMIDKIKSGMSAMAVANFLNKTNDDKANWQANTVLRILRNPALYGATRWNEDIYEETHKGIISKDEFIRLQHILEDRTNHHRREVKSTYLFQGVVTCPSCGNALSVNRYIRKRADGSEHQFALYRCQPCEKKKIFNKNIGEKKILDALYEYLNNDPFEYEEQEEIKEDPYLEKQLKQIERKREKYQRAWASDLISDNEFKKLMDETREVYEELKNKVKEQENKVTLSNDEFEEIVTTFKENFEDLTDEEKKVFISTFIKRINIEIIPQPPKRPDRSSQGTYKIKITKIDFY